MAISYFNQNPDVAASYAQNTYGLTPEAYAKFHYDNYGVNEKRISPQVAEVAAAGAAGSGTTVAPTFTPVAAAYFNKNPDVAQAYQENTYGLTPDQFASTHYQLYGQTEQRAAPTTIANVINTIGSNTATTANTATAANTANTTVALPAYFAQNPDVAAAYKVNTYGLTPEQYAAEHYKLYGGKEQRANPTAVTAITTGNLTSLPKYFQDNPDVAKSYLLNTYGLTPEQFAAKHFELYGQKEQRVAPVGPTTGVVTGGVTGGVVGGTPIAPPTVQVGQFRELFPSFAESKRLAGEMVTNRPSTQSIIDMIQGGKPLGAPTTAITGADNPYFIQNPDVFKSYGVNTFGLNPVDFAAAHYNQYGAGENRADPAIVAAIKSGNFSSLPTYFQQNKDVRDSYLTNTFGLNPVDFSAAHFNIYGEGEKRTSPSGVAPTNLANVISTIAK